MANTGWEGGANSGEAIRASLQGERDPFCLLATNYDQPQFLLIVNQNIYEEGTLNGIVDCVFLL